MTHDERERLFGAFIASALWVFFMFIAFMGTQRSRERFYRDQFNREAAEVGVLRFECDPRTGETKPFWSVPVAPCITRLVEAK